MKCNWGLSSFVKFLLRIYDFCDTAVLYFGYVVWNCLFTSSVLSHMHKINRKSTSRVETNQIVWFVGVDVPIQHPTSKGVGAHISGIYCVKASFEPKCSKTCQKSPPNFLLLTKMGSKCKILFPGPPKGISLHKTTPFEVLSIKISAAVLTVVNWKNPTKVTE